MGRIKVTLRVTDDAHRGWERTTLHYGVTLTALYEAVGLELLEHGVTTPVGMSVVERARQIDLERRSRR